MVNSPILVICAEIYPNFRTRRNIFSVSGLDLVAFLINLISTLLGGFVSFADIIKILVVAVRSRD